VEGPGRLSSEVKEGGRLTRLNGLEHNNRLNISEYRKVREKKRGLPPEYGKGNGTSGKINTPTKGRTRG